MTGYRSSLAILAVSLLASAQPAEAVPVEATLGIPPDSLAGTDPSGRVLLYTPNPLEQGSSVSHFDTSAFPDLLMEPANSPFLDFGQLDLTTFQMRDIGWPSGTSNMTLRIQDAPGQGFNDPALGAQRLAAMQFAVSVFAARLRSSVEINVDIDFESLTCDDGGGVLAQAGAQFVFESFPGAPISGTWYHGALAESLSGQNLSLEDVNDPNAGDLALTFNSQIDEACLGSGSRYYYGLNGNVPGGQISFISVALHELAHGLGFASFTNDATGAFFLGMPDIYSRFIFDNTQGRSWTQMTNSQRRTSAINPGRVAWNGSRVTQQAPNFLQSAPALTVNSPASIAGNYPVGTAEFGPPVTAAGLSGSMAVARNGSSSELCTAATNGSEISGRIAIVDRGNCNFTVKVRNAQNAGAIAVVVANNVGGLINMAGTDGSIVIPSVLISQADGQLIKDTLAQVLEPGSLRFNASTFNVVENEGPATITVRRSGGTDGAVSVDVTTSDGNATAGEDYTPAETTVMFGDGQGGTRDVEIEILDDLMVEGEETINLALSNPTGGATLGDPANAVLAIEENDTNPAGFVSFGAAEFLIREGEGNIFVTVERTGGTVGAISVDYTTGGGSATAGADYVATAGTINFADGEGGTKMFEVVILDDPEEELIETIGLALANPTGGTVIGSPGSALIQIIDDEACTPGPDRLCLNNNRFRAEVTWRDGQDNTGGGRGNQLNSDDSGIFWFFSANNLEMLVKVLDGCGVNDHFWVFAAATTDVEYTLSVTDTETGQVKEYENPFGVASPAITDTSAFPVCPEGRASDSNAEAELANNAKAELTSFVKASEPLVGISSLVTKETCMPDATSLCLANDRFRVEMEWRDFQGNTGTGQVELLENDDSGLFWFFNQSNLEVLVKVLDACGLNDRFWVFAAATTDVAYTLRVTDTMTGVVKEYTNPLGVASPAITDTSAFDTCMP